MAIADEAPKSTATYQFERMWPKLDQPWYFSSPVDVAIDHNGAVYIADRYGYIIQKFSKDGAFITQWGGAGDSDGQFDTINNIVVDQKGYIYITDNKNYRVQKFSSNGEFITTWGKYGTQDGNFQSPKGIAVDSRYVYIGDSRRIQKFTTDGEFVSAWRSNDYGENTYFQDPISISVDNDDHLYVLDGNRDSIQKFSSEGEFIDEFGKDLSGEEDLWNAQDIEIGNDGNIYVAKKQKKYDSCI